MKKTLLLAAAALALSGISSQAQVYSQNIVGYANVTTPNSGSFYSVAVPFKMGVSNGANEVFGSSLPEFSSILVWDAGAQTFNFYQTFSGSATGWADSGFADAQPPTLPVGKAFFLNPSAPVTNTFAGAIVVNVGTSNNMALPSSGVFYMVSPTVPYAGSVTNGNNSSGGVNLNGLPEFSSLLIWDSVVQNYTFVQTFSGSATGWADSGFADVPVPTLSVGQGFFINLSAPYTWTTGL
jgi:hypothetical protein